MAAARCWGSPPSGAASAPFLQDDAPLPQATAAEALAHGLETRGVAPDEIRRRVGEALESVRLAGFGPRRPERMSRGERQRLALARALVLRPDVLLLDEPFAAIDLRLREVVRAELKRLQREIGLTTLVVVHEEADVRGLADRVAVMFEGHVAALGPPETLHAAPEGPPVRDARDAANVIEGTVEIGEAGPRLVSGTLALALDPDAAPPPGPARYGIRPEDLELGAAGGATSGSSEISGTVEGVRFEGPVVSVLLAGPDGRALRARAPAVRVAEVGLARGDRLRLHVPPKRLVRIQG